MQPQRQHGKPEDSLTWSLWKYVGRGRQNGSSTLSSSKTHFDQFKPIEKLHFWEVPIGSDLKFQ